jgi:hypothetical protein
VIAYSRSRVDAVIREIKRLKDSDFPHKDSRHALEQIEKHFEAIRQDLSNLSSASDPRAVETYCSESVKQIFVYHRLLGFILRSTNVRNSFEIYGPVLRLSQQVLGPATRLVLSSEWEYSPHVYPVYDALPGVVLLGLPAAESGNPLLTPLAGHELGHTAWKTKNLERKFSKSLESGIRTKAQEQATTYKRIFGGEVADLFAARVLGEAYGWSARQAEETFCDFMGIRIFAESYFHAFAYLLAPGLTTQRSPLYPSTIVRVSNAMAAAKRFGIQVPDGFETGFVDALPANDERSQFLLALADAASADVVSGLLDEVDAIATSAAIPHPSKKRIKDSLDSFRLLVPAAGSGGLVNILNAGWEAYHDADLWQHLPNVLEQRTDVLNELVLKSVEILEIEQILGGKP